MRQETLLYRQVNPSWIQAGRVTSQLFKPTPKDENKLSVYDGDKISPKASWEHFVKMLGFKSIGVMAVTVQECKDQSLPVESDPTPFPEHVVIRFDGISRTEIETKAKRLNQLANNRGWCYRSDPRE